MRAAASRVGVDVPGNDGMVVLHPEPHSQALVEVLARGVCRTDMGMHRYLPPRRVKSGNDLKNKSAGKAFALVRGKNTKCKELYVLIHVALFPKGGCDECNRSLD